MITLDTSGIVAIVNGRDPDHKAVISTIEKVQVPYIVPVAILAEVAYFIESKMGQGKLEVFIEDIVDGVYVLDHVVDRWTRVLELVRRYADLPLGLADAAVIECAERHGGRVLTLDRRHFGAVAREGLIQVLP